MIARVMFRGYLMNVKNILCVFLLLGVSVFSHAQALPKKLAVPWPAGWQLQASQVKGNVLYEEAAQLGQGKEIQHVQITAMTLVRSEPLNDKSLRDFAESLRDTVLKMASEKSIELKPFPHLRGYYFSATDKTIKPNEYRQLIEGVMVINNCLVNFTLLTNDADGADAKTMVAALGRLEIQ